MTRKVRVKFDSAKRMTASMAAWALATPTGGHEGYAEKS